VGDLSADHRWWPMSVPTHARALTLIEQLSFRVAFRAAKTMPHYEYTMRDQQDAARETAYVQLFHLIQAEGVIEHWRGHKKRYLYPGDGYKYWAMMTFEPASRVINRMRIEDNIEQLRRYEREICP